MNMANRNQLECKEDSMYPLSVRSVNNNHTGQNYGSSQPYFNYLAYHHVPPALDNQAQSCGVWGSQYGSPLEDWNNYSALSYNANANTIQPSNLSPNRYLYNAPHPSGLGIMHSAEVNHAVTVSPESRNPASSACEGKIEYTDAGKTRSDGKYRVVYTDHQRFELEKAFHYSRYISIRRKAELAANLSLSERQVKIWFQNRRAKEKRICKKTNWFDEKSSSKSYSGSSSPKPLSNSLENKESPISPNQTPQLSHNSNNSQQPNGIIQVVTV